ncbi:MAG TPA: branched-chain amino acid ABC transporter permease [Acidimicrobiales bacterium]|nr:branched-chain amino acid ABC transporter permease [Acidimicrobiales bacterium]
MLQKKNLWWIAAVAALALFPVVEKNPTYMAIGFFTLVYMACATSWNMFSGYSGYISLGSAVFYGTGAYTMSLISIHANMAPGAAMFWIVPLAGLAAMVIALPFGWIALRVRRHTFVVITIAVFFIFQLGASNFSFTGGTSGLALPYITWGASYYFVPFYFVALGLVIVVTIISAALRRSRFGLQMLAIRDDEDRALGLGVKVTSVKIVGFTLSAFTVGMCGALYAMEQGQIYPQFVFTPVFDVSIALMTFLGGLGTLTGPLLGALILESSQQWLTISFSNGSLYLILFGALFLLVILFMPQGIVVYVRQRLSRKADLASASDADTGTSDVALSGGAR